MVKCSFGIFLKWTELSELMHCIQFWKIRFCFDFHVTNLKLTISTDDWMNWITLIEKRAKQQGTGTQSALNFRIRIIVKLSLSFLYLWERAVTIITFHHHTTTKNFGGTWLILKLDRSLDSSPQVHLIFAMKKRVNQGHYSPQLLAIGLINGF